MCVAIPALALTAAQTAIVGTSLAAAGISAYGTYQQGQTQKAVARNNAVMAEYAAQDAVRKAEDQVIAVRRKGDQIKGAQRASMAAKGLDLSSGTAAELQDQTDFFSEGDQNMARFNAQRDAWSLRAGGANARAQGEAAAMQGNLGAFGTVLGAGAQVADRWMGWNTPKKGG